MINRVNLLYSLNKVLVEKIQNIFGYTVIEFSQEELVRDKLENGELIIAYSLGSNLESSINHPKIRVIITAVTLSSPDSVFKLEKALGQVSEELMVGTSFDILDFDNSEAYLSSCVIINEGIQPHYKDGDRYLIKPLVLTLGYGNVFN